MIKKWLSWINLSIGGLIVTMLFAALIIAFLRPTEFAISDPSLTKRTLPTGSFVMPKQAYDAIGSTVFDLKFSPMPILLPDLRNQLVYCGKNGRPDSHPDNTTLHFAFNGNPNLATIDTGKKLYLQYDKKAASRYVFSPSNAETSLWLESSLQGNEAQVKLYMKSDKGDVIHEPAAHAQFNLPERENMRMAGRTWDMGKWRVDGSLLARQKARWMGPDRFLEKHGGEEYNAVNGKHRVEFTDEEDNYSVYVGLNDSLIWVDDRWKVIQPGQDSLKCPLMVVKRVEDRLMGFELWDVEGKGKIVLNLVKTNEPWQSQNLETCFKCVGARTRSQYIFEIEGQRVFLSPNDWILQTDDGWVKLTKAADIDDYVNRKITGPLFVFDGVGRNEERQVLLGTMFNPSRTETKSVELPIQQPGGRRAITETPRSRSKDHDDDDDDDFFEDDDDDDIPQRRPPLKQAQAKKQASTKKRVPEKKQVPVKKPVPTKNKVPEKKPVAQVTPKGARHK